MVDRTPSPSAKPQRTTRQGGAVRDALAHLDGFRSAQDVYASLRSSGDTIGLSTAYRHLQGLADAGEADVIHTAAGETTYRLCGGSGTDAPHHHHHLVCRVCGTAVEVEGRAVETWAAQVAAQQGFTEVEHTVEVFGVCPACARKS
jgi:Fur family transcriptional regulator, ferric uptake regulator